MRNIFVMLLRKLDIKFIRDAQAEELFENFIISAISSILVIRFYLRITDYPQIGGESYHIAHMLFGGLFMAVALIVLVSFIDRSSRQTASILGGIGFGTFIDELGKFVTADNNYFFQPTFALIYVVFIVIYLFFKFVIDGKELATEETLVNAFEMVQQALISGFTKDEKKEVISALSKIKSEHKISEELKDIVLQLKTIEEKAPSRFYKIKEYFQQVYLSIISNRWFNLAVTIIFVVEGMIAPVILSIIFSTIRVYLKSASGGIIFLALWESIFTTVIMVIILIGVINLYRSKNICLSFI